MRPKGGVQKIFQILPPNFIKGPYKSYLKFHLFCTDSFEFWKFQTHSAKAMSKDKNVNIAVT